MTITRVSIEQAESSAKVEHARAVVFDAFGTLVQIGQRLSPYHQLMRGMRDAGGQPQAEDATRIMSRNVQLADVGHCSAFPCQSA